MLVDTGDHAKVIRELTRVSVALDYCVVLAWTNEEAGRYMETFKAFENKTSDAIKARPGETTLGKVFQNENFSFTLQVSSVLTNIRSVNKTDVLTLTTHFKSMADIIMAEEKTLLLYPGFGSQKARRFREAMEIPFDLNTFEGELSS